MFDLDTAIHEWRHRHTSQGTLTREQLDELEDHIRSTHQALVASVWEPEEAWLWAEERLGTPTDLSTEFRKVEGVAWRRLLRLGWAAFAVSFFLPAHHLVVEFFGIDVFSRGWEAFWFALSGEGGVLGLASALTNLAALATLWRPGNRSRTTVLGMAGFMTAATLFNTFWLFEVDSLAELQVGFWMWLASYAMMAVGLALRAREAPEAVDSTRLLPASDS